MEYTIQIRKKTIRPEDGGNIYLSLCVPEFGDEKLTALYAQAEEKVLGYYRNLRLPGNVPRLSLSADCRIMLCTDEAVSLYFDIRQYTADTLTGFFRISQNWELLHGKKDNVELFYARSPKIPDNVKKEAKLAGVLPQSGYYRTASETVLFRNIFVPGDGEGLRRSRQDDFIRKFSFSFPQNSDSVNNRAVSGEK